MYDLQTQVYSAAREGHLPEVISYVNKYTLTPLPGLLFTGVLAVVFTLLKDIGALLNMYMVAASFFYGLCMLALIVLRFKMRDVERAFKVYSTFLISYVDSNEFLSDLDRGASVHHGVFLVLHHLPSHGDPRPRAWHGGGAPRGQL